MKKERTLVVIKPDGVQRSLIGEIIKRFERVGLKLVGLKFFVPNKDLIEKHYTIYDGWFESVGNKGIKGSLDQGKKPLFEDPIEMGKFILNINTKYVTSGPVVAMVWEGVHSVEIVRKLVGNTEPRSSDVGTIRGDFVLDSFILANTDKRSVRNIIHASSSVEDANLEIKLWFKDNEIIDYRLVQEQILYDVNLDGILE